MPGGQKLDLSLRADDELAEVDLTRRTATYSYKDGDAFVFLDAEDYTPWTLDPDVVGAAAITYLEGYLWDPNDAKDAFRKAAEIAHAAGRLVALTLSDAFCVDRWRNELLALARTGTVDVLLANESELKSLYMTADFDGEEGDARLARRARHWIGDVRIVDSPGSRATT